MNNNKKIKIVWGDVRVYSPNITKLIPSTMETTGLLEREDTEYILVRDPITIRQEDGLEHPKKRPTFYLIPKRMIISTIEV